MGGINWGDVPTWLAVGGASVGGYAALRQLRDQRAEFTRQVRQLERQQANQVDLSRIPISDVTIPANPQLVQPAGAVMVIENKSNRPIRDVRCHLQGTDFSTYVGQVVRGADYFGELVPAEDHRGGHKAGGPYFIHPLPGEVLPLARSGARYGFVFGLARAAEPDAPYYIYFLDDSGLSWMIDQDLHLFHGPPPDPPPPA